MGGTGGWNGRSGWSVVEHRTPCERALPLSKVSQSRRRQSTCSVASASGRQAIDHLHTPRALSTRTLSSSDTQLPAERSPPLADARSNDFLHARRAMDRTGDPPDGERGIQPSTHSSCGVRRSPMLTITVHLREATSLAPVLLQIRSGINTLHWPVRRLSVCASVPQTPHLPCETTCAGGPPCIARPSLSRSRILCCCRCCCNKLQAAS
jgi:hypothetical protein